MEVGNNKQIIIVVIILAVIIIILAGLFYYFAIDTLFSDNTVPVSQTVNIPTVEEKNKLTTVFIFEVPEVLPEAKETGDCFASSTAYPYRKDAFRCMIGNSIYDPCFETLQKTIIFCQPNPLKEDVFSFKLTKPLPAPENPSTVVENWAWFVKLKDGTECSPFTGTRPFFGMGAEIKVAYYGCSSANPNEQYVLIEDLIKDEIWQANKAILTKDGRAIKSIQKVEVETVWQ